MTDTAGSDVRERYVKYEYRIPMRDGVRLRVDVFRPETDEPVAVLGATAIAPLLIVLLPLAVLPAVPLLLDHRPALAVSAVTDDGGGIPQEQTRRSGLANLQARAAEVTPAVCKASAGAVEHLKIARVRNLADFLVAAKEQGRWVYGAETLGEVSYKEVHYGDETVLVLGSEGSGLRPRVASECDALMAIPMRGRIESLSVSAAAAVLVYAAKQGAA